MALCKVLANYPPFRKIIKTINKGVHRELVRKVSMSSSEFRHIVRLGGRDLNGKKKLIAALADIKGIGFTTANAIVNRLNLDPNVRLGSLSEADLKMIDDYVKSLHSYIDLPYLLNRRRDPSSGSNIHLISSDLEFIVKEDIRREKEIMSWRGVRHSLGLKVRGQRTRTTGRKGMTVGVRKGAAKTQSAGEKEKGKK